MATYGTYNSPGPFKLTVYGIVILFSFFIMFYVVRGFYRDENPGPLNSARAAERLKARQDLTAKAQEALNKGGMVDTNKGIARIPINRAMQMMVQAYKNPEAAHADLVSRAEKAAAPAPAPPPIEFE
jgi:hypothetical protein